MKIPVLPLFIIISHLAFGQTPLNDLNWQADSAASDEFNSDSINTVMWHILDCPGGDCCNWGGGTAFQKGNATESGGLLRLRVDGPGIAPVPCDRNTFATGGVVSNSPVYQYGYYEISAELPGFISNGTPCAQKFEPTFWMDYDTAHNGCVLVHNEIDIFDISGYADAKSDTVEGGWWFQNGHCGTYTPGGGKCHSSSPLFQAFHKYALEWDSNSLVFYFDDVPYYAVYNDPVKPMHSMKLYIDEQLTDSSLHFCPNIPFPQYYLVDYFRHYALKTSCGSHITLLDSAALAAYQFSVKSSLTFGNGSDSISLKSTDVKYFRAADSITIYGTFTAPLGSELGLIPTPCN